MKLVSLKIIKNGIHGNPSPRDFHLYYVLKGNAQIEEGNNVLPLDTGEMLVINPGESVTLKCESGTVLECRISHSEVLRLMGYQRKVIVCNTHLVKNENTDELRRVLGSLVRSYYEPDQNLIEREQYSLSLVYLLIAHFSNNVFEENDESRKNEIASYIEANYADEVTLEMIADEFGLTPQYFSRYFSNVFRTSFLKYLNHVRLEHAVDDLLNTKETVLRIAVNHGFANVASFNREFQNVYHTTPGSYRQKHGSKQEKIEKDDILSILNEKADENGDDTVRIDVHMEGSYPPLKKYWTEILNCGSFEMMMKSRMSEQVTFLNDTLKFRRARLYLDTFSPDGRHHFYTADRVMEFFVRSHMDLIIVIDYRSLSNEELFISYFREQCMRFANRFGTGIQDHTVFEIEYRTKYDDEKLASFASFYEKVSDILRECSFDSEIIGPSVLVDESGENFRRFVKAVPAISTYTIFCAPYTFQEKGSEIFINRLTDAGYVLEQYRTACRILSEEKRDDASVLIVGWKDRLNDIDVLNETVWMGARIIRNVLEGYGTCSCLPLDLPLDLLFDETSYDRTFNLLPGIITSAGIIKPSYHALKLLDQQDEFLAAVSKDYLVTKSADPGYAQILIHNCKKPGYGYYTREILDQPEDYEADLFEDSRPAAYEIRIDGLDEGDYLLKTRIVNDDSGCAFTRYLNMKYADDSFVGYGEREYLKAASVIPVIGETLHAGRDGILNIKCTLAPNEFRHLHLIKVRR